MDAAALGVKRDGRAGFGLSQTRERSTARRRTMLRRTVKPCGSGTRCWCQVGGGFGWPDRVRHNRQFADDGDKTNSSPGRARYKP